MKVDLAPDTRRLVMQYAAAENVNYGVALECLVLEVVKAVNARRASFPVVHKPVQKSR